MARPNMNGGRGNRGLLGNNGKGDKSRVTDTKTYAANISEIPLAGLKPGERFRKVYGAESVRPSRTGPHIKIN